MDISFFEPGVDADTLVPLELARSLWNGRQLHGVAVSGALARSAERCIAGLGRADLVPARWTVDLFRPADTAPCRLVAHVVREGRRVCLVDVELSQEGRPVARATAMYLKPTEAAPGAVWAPAERYGAPPPGLPVATDEPRVPMFHSSAGWSTSFGDHQDATRKQSWTTAVPVLAGERPTGFQAAASVADGASMVTNWGTNGVEYINADITLTLVRPPVGVEIGMSATDRVEQDGVAVGTAHVFDRSGPLGTAVVTALANARRTVDFAAVEFTDDGQRIVPPA